MEGGNFTVGVAETTKTGGGKSSRLRIISKLPDFLGDFLFSETPAGREAEV